MPDSSFPAHKLCWIGGQGDDVLLAVTGSCIQSLSFKNGNVLSSWPRDEAYDSADEDDVSEERPSKRLRIDENGNPKIQREGSDLSEGSIQIIAEGKQRQKGERRKPKIPDTTLPNVSHLVATTNGRHAIAITAEDKAVRVFAVSRKGRLRQLSSRCMPKKSCAITLAADEETILTADKFGDVYALPLHPDANYKPKPKTPQPEKPFTPSASELTVHTKGNLDALRQQQMQNLKHIRKEVPNFEHKLLLGHVSLLTDLCTAEATVEGKTRSFIVTADRDEHIRVSRGIPQTHIIHAFCLGHTEFISRLCMVPWAKDILVAGNGEPSLQVYDWREGNLLSRFDIIEHLKSDIDNVLSSERSTDKLAVSGIWPVQLQSGNSMEEPGVFLVALEALPLLFSLKLDGPKVGHLQTLKLRGNVLDVVHVPQTNKLVVSLDLLHESGSSRNYRTEPPPPPSGSIEIFDVTPAEVLVDGVSTQGVYFGYSASNHPLQVESVSAEFLVAKRDSADDAKPKHEKQYSALGEFIYGLENLRKRRGKVLEDDEEDGEGVEVGEMDDAPVVRSEN